MLSEENPAAQFDSKCWNKQGGGEREKHQNIRIPVILDSGDIK